MWSDSAEHPSQPAPSKGRAECADPSPIALAASPGFRCGFPPASGLFINACSFILQTALAAVAAQPGATQPLLAGDLIPSLPPLEDPPCLKLKLL